MTQRSAERWNTGKRGASQRRAEKKGWRVANLFSADPFDKADWNFLMEFFTSSALSPHLAAAFRRGAWMWVERQPVEF